MTDKTFNITENSGRIDKFLAEVLSQYSRSEIQNWIQEGNVLVNQKKIKTNYKLLAGDTINVHIPVEEPIEMLAENIPLEILYEDSELAVVIKPKGMVVHPGVGNEAHTLVNTLLHHFDHLSDFNGELRPGIVHRHDKETSGVLVIAKTNKAHKHLANQFKNHTPTRHYLALVHDDIPHESGEIDVPIGRDPHNRKKFAGISEGKDALTRFTVKEHFSDYALVEAALYTGRTHQIRVHFNYIKHPIVGDDLYGYNRPIDKDSQMCLFANKLGFEHPTTGEYMEFEAKLPDFFKKIIKQVRF